MAPQFLFLLCLLSIVVLVVVLVLRYEKKRIAALSKTATDLGFAFSEGDREDLVQALAGFSLGGYGRSRAATNVLAGQVDATEILIFDYQYTTGSGKSRHTVRQTVMLLRFSDGQLPPFSLQPEGILHKISEILGYNDIDFDVNPRFSKLYLLKSPSEPAIRELFSGEVIAFYESRPGLCTEAQSQALLFYRPSKRVSPEELARFYEDGWTAYALLRHIPATAG